MTAWKDLIAFYTTMRDVSPSFRQASLAQWILESVRGASDLASKHHNFAGPKFRARLSGGCEAVDFRSSENDLTTYRKFTSIEEFVEGLWHFITSGPYDGWPNCDGDPKGYIRQAHDHRYAADDDCIKADPNHDPVALARFRES